MRNLEKRLKGLPKEELKSALNYYNEYFLDANVDNKTDVESLVGSPDEVARNIISECTDKIYNVQKKNGGVRNDFKLLWMIILGIFAAPIGLPLLIASIAIIFAVVVTVFSLLLGAIGLLVAVIVTGIAMIPAMFFSVSWATRFIIIGVVLVSISIAIILCGAVMEILSSLIRLLARIMRKIFKRKEKQ